MTDFEFQQALLEARLGNERAFEVLWRQFNPRLVRVLHGLGGNQDVDDLASAVWVDVLRSLEGFRGDEDAFRGWLYTIARRRLIDLRRRESRRPQVSRFGPEDHEADLALDPAAAAEEGRATEAALALIATLPPDQAEVVLLRVVAGLDVAQVAEIVGRKPGTVRVMAHRGLRRLAVLLADQTSTSGSGAGVTP
jgi:RNA polymerase sigma-70 factor (ECF subfamily)